VGVERSRRKPLHVLFEQVLCLGLCQGVPVGYSRGKRGGRILGFDTEPSGYEKTILSDLQGAWQCLRQEVADNPGFHGWDRALFHIDEAMSWESVRNLRAMQRSLLLVRNILQQADDLPEGAAECLQAVSELMDETLEALASGEI
jgi:hypothetical protein